MLSFRPENGGTETALDVETLPPGLTWIDALRPDAREIAFLERALGIKVPSLETLSEIETSSRLRSNKEWLHLSIPMIYQKDGFLPAVTPLGFAVSKDLLLTVRFKPMKAFETVRENLLHTPMEPGGPGALIAVLEAIVDHAADMLESTGVDLDHLSEEIFGTNGAGPGRHRPREDADQLRTVMRKIGRHGDLTSKVADLLLGIGRLVPFVLVNAAPYLDVGVRAQLKSLQRDINSLDDYETHLTDKIHFLLDATLGLTNTDQNNIFRILTVVSVVGIPPTFFASMWGMNFKNIHEYDWAYGYAFALAVIALSALIPIIWFKWRGWF